MKWKKKWEPALWTKVFGKGADQPKRKNQSMARAVSNTMRLMLDTYKAEKRKWWGMSANRYCRKCGRLLNARNRTLHHKNGRLGQLLLFKKLWIPLCLPCHDWVHSNPNEARKLDLLCEVGQWNSMPSK